MMLKNITQNVYEKEVKTSAQPALLCFFKNTISHSETALSVAEISQQFDSIQFYAVQEEDHEIFFEKFHFGGTPIFIFLVNGIERERLMGTVSIERFRAFVERNISSLKGQ